MEFRQWLTRNIGGTILGLLIITAFIFFLAKDISNRTETIKERRRELTSRLQAFGSLALLRSDAERAGKLFVELQNSLPQKDQLIGFSKALEGFAKNNQLDFGFFFEAEAVSTDVLPGRNEFKVTSSGSYANFIRFLKKIEESQYFVNFNLFDLAQKGKEFDILMRGGVFSQ